VHVSGKGREADAYWRVRIRGQHGAICGGGVLLDPWHVLTCAHVVATALGASAEQNDPPAGTVLVDLPASPGTPEDTLRQGSLSTTGWLPVRRDGRGDAAVLELSAALGTQGAALARLGRSGNARGRAVRVFGYPRHIDHGLWAQAQLTGTGGPGGQWVQLDGVSVQGRRVTQGFSGSGVIDDSTGRVVGIVVAEDRLESAKVAWMLPLDVLGTIVPPVLPLPELRTTAGYRRGSGESSRSMSRVVTGLALLTALLLAIVTAVVIIRWPRGDGAARVSAAVSPNASASASATATGSELIQASAAWCSGARSASSGTRLVPGTGPRPRLIWPRPCPDTARSARCRTLFGPVMP
jgi:hypothetical protein